MRYGPDGLALLREGLSADEVVARLTEADEGRAERQLGVVDAQGRAATYTGEGCLDWAGGMLSAKSDTVDIVVGLELGADDYVTKPFELPELVARVRAALRRASAIPEDPVLARGDLEIDPAAFVARKGGEEVNLTATEFKLLLELARRPGQVFTRELLLERVWNYEYLGDSRLVDVAVQRLRAKVEDDAKEPKHIKTVRGVGYRFDVE